MKLGDGIMKLNDLLYSDSLGIYALFKCKAPQPNRIVVYDLTNECVRILDKSRFRVIETPLFREGDIITVIKGINLYGVTNEKGTYKVEELQGTEDMVVRVLNHPKDSSIGCTFSVRKVFFRLVKRKGNFRR